MLGGSSAAQNPTGASRQSDSARAMASHLRNSPRQDRPTPHSLPSPICEGNGERKIRSAAFGRGRRPRRIARACAREIVSGKPEPYGRTYACTDAGWREKGREAILMCTDVDR